MNRGTALTLAFGTLLIGALMLSSGIRNRSLSEVLAGKTSLLATDAETAEAATSSSTSTSTGSSPGGGTRGAQKEFGKAFAAATGLDLGVVEKWLLAEQPPGSPATPGSNNWLNVQYTDSGPNATYYRIARLPPRQAAQASARWLSEQSGLRGILASAHKSPREQEQAIINSGWASSHYGGHL